MKSAFARRACIPVIAILVLLGTTPIGARSLPRDSVGYVGEIRGRWYVVGSPQIFLSLGMIVNAGDTLRAAPTSGVEPILSVVFRTGAVASATCDRPGPNVPVRCKDLIVPNASASPQGWIARALDEVMTKLHGHEPEQYASLVSRGAGAEPADAVVPIRRGRLDLSAPLAPLAPGTYQLCIAPIALDTTGSPTAEHPSCTPDVVYRWAPGRRAPAWPGSVSSGLYTLRLAVDGEPTEAWLLIANPYHYAAAAHAFARLRTETRGWRGQVSSTGVRRVLRAYLVALATRPPTHARAPSK